jgi:dipeptidyl aminopeptidase/acylaminoacyl peptidase
MEFKMMRLVPSFQRFSVLVVLVAWSAAGVAQTPARQVQQAGPPILVPSEEMLAQFPAVTGFQLSPDAKHLLAIESRGDQRTVVVWKTDDLAAKPNVIGSRNMRIERASFLKNDRLAVTLSQPFDARLTEVTKTFINKLMVTDLEGKNWAEPLEANNTRSDTARRVAALQVPTVKSRLLADPDHVIVESDGLGLDRDLFRYNVRTGAAQRVMRLGEDDLTVRVDGKGVPYTKSRGGNDSKGLYVAIEIRNPDTGQWEEHFRSYVKDRDEVEIVGTTPKPGIYILRSNVGREFTALFEYDSKARKILNTLFEHRYFDATGVRTLAKPDESDAADFSGFAYLGLHGNEVQWVDASAEAVIKGVAQSLGLQQEPVSLVDPAGGQRADVRMFTGAAVSIVDFRPGAVPTYLIRVSGLNYPTEHYLLRGQQLRLLGREFPQVDRRALGTSSLVYYKARDGLNVPALLTVPNKQLCGAGPYAAVVHPHGGPWSRDTMDYDRSGWVPLMVSRCQVVLQPQFRGSTGWGRTLWKAGDAEWGQKMQDDKDDGAAWLVKEGLADAKRIGIFGFSYGGYAAMAAAVRGGAPFKCAVSGAGVSDIERIWARFYTNPFFRERQEPTVRGLSPLRLADQLKIPLMIYHGDRDQTAPLVQSELFANKARAANQPVEYHVLRDYGHGPAWTRETMARQLKLIGDYFAKGCGGSGL